MSDHAPTICVECDTPHTRRIAHDAKDLFTSLGADRADPYCSDECRDGADVRTVLGRGGRCTTCTTWSSTPFVPTHEFGTMYCSRACMPDHLQKRETELW